MRLSTGLLRRDIHVGSIIVWDRSLGGVKEAGFRPGVHGYQLKSIARRDGYDRKAVLSAPLLGKLVRGISNTSATSAKYYRCPIPRRALWVHFSKIVSTEVDKVINVPVTSISETNGIAGRIYKHHNSKHLIIGVALPRALVLARKVSRRSMRIRSSQRR